MTMPTSDPIDARPVAPATGAVCPYLLSADGAWRSAGPTREHRCTAVTPPSPLAPEKQRRLCLVAEHVDCSTFRAAVADHGRLEDLDALAPTPNLRRAALALPRTTPLVLDHGRVAVSMPALRLERSPVQPAQFALVAVLAVAVLGILIARPSFGGDGREPDTVAGGAGATATARPTSDATPAATAARTLVPTEVEPTAPPATDAPEPTASPEPEPTASPAPTDGPATYTVKSGDTLDAIATAHGTTWQVLAELNDLEDPGSLRVGQVIKLP